MMRYLLARARFEAALLWCYATRGRHAAAPEYLLDAYNAMTHAWNQRGVGSRE